MRLELIRIRGDNVTIKPIETVYKGYRFRSRLEARWAVFFDALGIEWEYEPEGYLLDNGERYLPDFYLPNDNLYIEVKGVHPNDQYIKMLEKFGDDSGKAVLLVVGLPDKGDHNLYCYDSTDSNGGTGWHEVQLMSNPLHEGHVFFYRFFDRYDRSLLTLDLNDELESFCQDIEVDGVFYRTNGKVVNYLLINEMKRTFTKAAIKAKQARFEHGAVI